MPRLLTILALALGLLACAKGATTSGPAKLRAVDYHPLAVGNQWTYAVKGQTADRTVTIKAIKDGYFADDENGMLKVDAEGLRDEKRYLLKEPVERGKTWTSVVSVSSTEHYQIMDVGFTVTTQAGTFANCVLVRGTNRIDQTRSLVLEWTFAPEVGIVRFGSAMVEGGKSIPQVVTELKSYKLVKP